MIDLFQLYEKVCGTYNTQQGGHIRPHRNFVDWANDISMQLFEEYVAVDGKSQQIEDYLSPFTVSVNVIVKATPGSGYDEIVNPADYEHYRSARVFYDKDLDGQLRPGLKVIDGACGIECENPYDDEDEKAVLEAMAEDGVTEKSISKIDNQRWGAICDHRTMKPTKNNVKITQQAGGFKVAPKQLGVIVLDYYRKPKLATFNYTITNPGSIDEYFQYDALTSTPLEWSYILVDEFVNRIGKKYGQFIRESFVFETSELNKKTTI